MTPDTEDKLRDQLVRHEKLRTKAYDDATGEELKPGDTLRGKLTISVGRNLTDVGVSAQESMYLLDRDIDAANATLVRNLPWFGKLDEVRQAALVNMQFNMGWVKLSEFRKMLAYLSTGENVAAALEALDSEWAKEVGDGRFPDGTPQRALELSLMIRTGNWQ